MKASADVVTAQIAENVARWLRFVGWTDGEPIELQALKVQRGSYRQVNYFAHAHTPGEIARLLSEAERWNAPGIYYVANAINPAVATRAEIAKWHEAQKGEVTSDNDIATRRALFIDIDVTRPKNTSSTAPELARAQAVTDALADRLASLIPPQSIGTGMSGNGCAVMLALDSLPNADDVERLIKGVLAAIKCAYDTDGVEIDPTVCDAKRLCPAWGTMKRKGVAGNAERPHRRTSFTCADEVQRLRLDDLRRLLDELTAPLTDEQRAAVDKAMGKRSAASASSTATNRADRTAADDVFRLANACDVQRVADRLGLLDGEYVKCPGCGTVGDSSVAFVGNGVNCKHRTCAGKGKPAGNRTCVDLVAEVQNCTPIEAARTICDWFGIDVPEKTIKSGTRSAPVSAPAGGDWPAPLPLLDGLPPVPALEPDMLPEAFRDWITDVVERTQCPIEFAAAGAIVSLSALIGRQCAIRPKRHDDWTVIPNLWGAAVGRPGVMKTPTLTEATKPLSRLAVAAHKSHDAAMKDFETRQRLAKQKQAVIEAEVKRTYKEEQGEQDSAKLDALKARRDALVAQLQECEIDPPTPRRYLVNDATTEKLIEILRDNPNGLLQYRDELIGWLKSCEREGRETDRAFYLECWTGDGNHLQERIGRGSVRVDGLCLSVLGGIQPGPLTDYLVGALRGGAGADGLISRFQILVYPDDVREWRNVDRYPNADAKNRAYAVFERLDGATIDGADQDRDGQRFVRFDDEAQGVFDQWRKRLEDRLRDSDEAPVMLEHLSKYRSLMPSLALIFQLADTAYEDRPRGPVAAAAAHLAIRWCELLETHARRVYAVVIRRTETAAALLARRIETGKLHEGFTVREVQRAGWSGLTERDDVEQALGLLEDLHWVRSYEPPPDGRGGRPTRRYAINPVIIAHAAKKAA